MKMEFMESIKHYFVYNHSKNVPIFQIENSIKRKTQFSHQKDFKYIYISLYENSFYLSLSLSRSQKLKKKLKKIKEKIFSRSEDFPFCKRKKKILFL